jgi:hypothetical protein
MNGHDDKRTTPPTPHRLRFLIQPAPLACLAMLATGSALAMNGTSSMSSSIKAAQDHAPHNGLLKESMVQSTVGRRGTTAPIRYRMEPLPYRPDDSYSRAALSLPSKGTSHNGITNIEWSNYALFRLNDGGQVSGWTNLHFCCDDQEDSIRSGNPTAATWTPDASGRYDSIQLLSVDGVTNNFTQNAICSTSSDGYMSKATGISENGHISGFWDDDPCNQNFNDSYQAVFWERDANGAITTGEVMGCDDPSAAFDVIDVNGGPSMKLGGIINHTNNNCNGGSEDSDVWFTWAPGQEPRSPSLPSDIKCVKPGIKHGLEFLDIEGSKMIGTGRPRYDLGYCPDFFCGLTAQPFYCCEFYRGFGCTLEFGAAVNACDSVWDITYVSWDPLIQGTCPTANVEWNQYCFSECDYEVDPPGASWVQGIEFANSEINRAADPVHEDMTGTMLERLQDSESCRVHAIYRSGPGAASVIISDDPDNTNSQGYGIRNKKVVGWEEHVPGDGTQAMLWEQSGGTWSATNLDELLQDGQICLDGLERYEDRPFPDNSVCGLDLRLREAHDINNNGEIVAILRFKPNQNYYKDIAVVLIPDDQCTDCCMGCMADFNGDGSVDGADLTRLLGCWGTPDGAGCSCIDLDGDGNIDGADLTMLLGNWGICRGAGSVRESKK